MHFAASCCPEDVEQLADNELGPDLEGTNTTTRSDAEQAHARFNDVVRLLLKSGANPVAKTARSETPLHLAARNGSDVVRVLALLDSMKGSDINCRDRDGATALSLAAEKKNVDVALPILEKMQTTDSGTRDMDDTLLWAAGKEDTHWIVQLLLQKRKTDETSDNVRAEESSKWSALE